MANPFHALNRPVRKYHTFTNNGLTATPPDPKRGKQATGRLQIEAMNPAYLHMRLTFFPDLTLRPFRFILTNPLICVSLQKGKNVPLNETER